MKNPAFPVLAILLSVIFGFPETPQAGPEPVDRWEPVVVSANGHFLQYKDGKPFFWLGDTAWNLFQRLDRIETERYLENRRLKGFNVIQAVAFHDSGERNAYGASALLDNNAGHPDVTPGNDFSKPGEYDYWDHIDWVVDLAAKKGIYIAILPVWGSSVKTGTLNAENAGTYARWLAARYRDKQNIFWILGGDIRGDSSPEIWKAMGRTLKQEDPNHLITYHPFGRTQSSTWFHDEPWLDFNMFQSGHRRYDQDDAPGAKGEDNWRYANEDYARRPPKPTLDGEPSYENIPQGLHDSGQPYWTDKECRRYAYWSVFAGSAGHTFGNNAVMQMHKPDSGPGAFGVRDYWYEAIDEPGSGQMQYLRFLILSRPYLDRVPDQGLIAGENGVRDNYIAATRGRAYLFAYVYAGRPFNIRMGAISGKQARAWFYDPRNGSAQQIGLFPNRGIRAFTPPGSPAHGNDWVLVLDDAAQKFAVPGAR
ncbi:MAG TPA: glycoside hydrolase family 140 protein [Methylomirabilota bacterium]|nr:glycoside hydrolase family 140 protein [Methylomirabilota bacterium]